jgi:WD40 repeat protein
VILAGSEDFTAWLWNANSGACLNVFSGHSGSVTCGDFTPDGKSFCTGAGDGSLRIWNPKSAESTHVVQGHPYHTQGVLCLAIHADSSFVITGSEDKTACIVNLQNGRITGTLAGHTKSVETVGLSSMLPLAATGGMDGKLIIWDLQSLTLRSTCEHEDGVVKMIWPSSSHLIYTGCLDAKVRIWDSRTGDIQRILQGHQDSILDLAVSRDGKYIVSGSDDGTARAYDLQYPLS